MTTRSSQVTCRRNVTRVLITRTVLRLCECHGFQADGVTDSDKKSLADWIPPERSFRRFPGCDSSPSSASTPVALCFSARDHGEFAKSVGKLWPVVGVGICGTAVCPYGTKTGERLERGACYFPPFSRCLFLIVFVFLDMFCISFCRDQGLVDTIMDVASDDDDGLVLVLDRFGRGHEAHVFFVVMWQGGASTNLPRVKRGEVNSGSLRRSLRGPFTSGCVRSLYSRTSTIMRITNDGGSRRPDVG